MDAAIDAVGHPDALELACRVVRKAGTVSAIGVYAERVQVHMGIVWIKALTLKTGHANVIGHVDRVLAMLRRRRTRPRAARHAPHEARGRGGGLRGLRPPRGAEDRDDAVSVERGTAAMLTRRREILAQGAEPIGWKIGFNVPEIQERLGIDAPLAGFLTSDSLVEDDWDEYPVIVESEVAVEVGDDGRSIAALFPALELADPPDLDLEIEQILAGQHLSPSRCVRTSGGDPGARRRAHPRKRRGATHRAARRRLRERLEAMVEAVAARLADAGEELRPGRSHHHRRARPAPQGGARRHRPARARRTGGRGAPLLVASGGMSTDAATLPDALSDAARSFAAGPHRLRDRRGAPRGGRRAQLRDLRSRHGARDHRGALRGHGGRGPRRARRARGLRGRALERHRGGRAHQRDAGASPTPSTRTPTSSRELESLDNGKPVKMARRVDVPLAAAHLRYFAGWPTRISGEVLPVAQPNMHCYTRKEPVGVAGQIIPWNFPLLMAAWKVAPALAAGCTIVLKPAEQTPLTALRLGELALEAGLPEGVLNVITGDGETGAALVDHPDVDKIAFTGSTAVGREIGAKAGRALKRVTLELGGKSPNIILPDADLTPPSRAPTRRSTTTPARPATPARGCSCTGTSTTTSCPASPRRPARRGSAPGSTRRRRWAR